MPVFTVTVTNVSIADEPPDVNQPAELDLVLRRLRHDSQTPSLALAGRPRPLSGGFWAEMWALPLTQPAGPLPAEVVLRLAPDAALAARETVVQSGAAAQGFPTPRIHASDTSHNGWRAWSVMDLAPGRPLLAGLGGVRALSSLPRLATSLPDALARVAADLHRLDPDPIDNALDELGGGSVGIDSLLDHYLIQAEALDDQPLRRLVERLAGTRPPDEPRVVCHGDLHPFNVLAAGDRHIVLDWTAARIAHPAYDLAFTRLLLANPPLHAPRALRPVIDAAARRIANRFLASYAKLGPYPVDPDILEWYHSLHACRILIDLGGWRASGAADSRGGHPWFAIEPTVRALLDA